MSDRDAPDDPSGSGSLSPASRRLRVEAVVRGRVQGVGFRIFVARTALGLGLGGWVANEPGGSVRCIVEGPGASVESFLRELARGPLGSDVVSVDVVRGPASGGLERFEIRSGWHSGD